MSESVIGGAASAGIPAQVHDADRLSALDGYAILDTLPEENFDSIVELAAHICACPVALVSFVAKDRQWFKARIGFPECETDLNRSVCAHALVEPDLLIVSDLTLDPRSALNPLVTHDPHIRFYAGAPLRTDEGEVLGSLCVIDGIPRPGGLTDAQKSALRALARQVMSQLKLRKALAERDALLRARHEADERLAALQGALVRSEEYWRSLFERLDEGYLVGELVRNASGHVVDWRFVDVNAAWSTLTGLEVEAARGRTAREVFPGMEQHWIDDFARVVESGESMRFTRELGFNGRWYEGHAFKLAPERFAVIFLEATERLRAEARRNGLLALGDRLRDLGTVPDMIRAAAAIIGRTLRVQRVAFGRLEVEDDTIVVEADWTTENMASIVGRHRFSNYGDDLPIDLAQGKPLIIDDVRHDPRTARRAEAMLALGVNALVNVPVNDRDRPVAALIAHSSSPRKWASGELIFLRNAADRLEAGIARLRAEAQQTLLNHELSHRMKNTMAMIQAIASQTLKNVGNQEAVENFKERLYALSTAHDVLLQQNWIQARILQAVAAVMKALGSMERVRIAGPDIVIGPRAVLSLSLLLHELTTNAVKYGSLSVPGGSVHLAWTIDTIGGEEIFDLTWREVGGPPAIYPSRKGFGHRLIRMGLIGTGGVTTRFLATGFEAQMQAPLAELQQS